ncbi:hypothetical protein BDQ17DRAFT_1329720 [Cyathus striatus]|nr:hypothetical protein BDQ17DRAFT_1329720 [Cyathus striatus]
MFGTGILKLRLEEFKNKISFMNCMDVEYNQHSGHGLQFNGITTFEVVNLDTLSHMSLHTFPGYNASTSNFGQSTTSIVNTMDCSDSLLGCATTNTEYPSYGTGFNNGHGGLAELAWRELRESTKSSTPAGWCHRILKDPSGEVCPNYRSEEYEEERNLLVGDEGAPVMMEDQA